MIPSPRTESHAEQRWNGDRWQLGAASTAGILAMLAGIISLLADQQSNLAVLHQMRATSHWAHYQAKSIRKHILQGRIELGNEIGRKPGEDLFDRVDEYEREKGELSTEAWNAQNETTRSIRRHDTFSIGLTLFHVAIALATLSLMSRRRFFWYSSILFGVAGCVQFVIGLLSR